MSSSRLSLPCFVLLGLVLAFGLAAPAVADEADDVATMDEQWGIDDGFAVGDDDFAVDDGTPDDGDAAVDDTAEDEWTPGDRYVYDEWAADPGEPASASKAVSSSAVYPSISVKVDRLYSSASSMVDAINAKRSAAGVGGVTADKNLTAKAMKRAAEAAVDYNHRTLQGVSTYGSELLTRDPQTADVAIYYWTSNEAASTVLLASKWKSVGVGHVSVNGVHYWAVAFSTNAASGSVPSADQTSVVQKLSLDPSVLTEDGVELKVCSSSLSDATTSVKVGNSEGYALVAEPKDNAYFKTPIENSCLTWSTSKGSVATVSADGTLKCVGKGTVKLTATVAGTKSFKAQTASVSVSVSNKVRRLGGDLRYDTAKLVVDEGFTSCDAVILASGENFPDALGAAALAGVEGCPVLLTASGSLSSQAKAEISRLGAKNVIIVGGTSAVSATVERQLKSLGKSVERVWGRTRQQTAVKIAKRVGESESCNTVIVASGSNYPDALSVSSYAYAKRYPILLTEGDGTLSDATVKAIRELGAKNVIIVGGYSAVKSSVEGQLKGLSVSRWAGSTRYETSVKVAEKACADGMSVSTVAVASGENFPDALCAGPVVGEAGGVLLLSAKSDASVACSWLKSRKSDVNTCLVLGGTNALSAGVEKSLATALK